ncbi:MAG: VanW family protein [Clostridia bacterium]|nr:VanW family protein [Clostridia bacterium]
MMKRLWALLLALTLTLTLLTPALAEDDDDLGEISEEEERTILEMDAINDDAEARVAEVGPVFEEPTLKDFDLKSTAVYTCRVKDNSYLYAERDIASAHVCSLSNARTCEILYVGVNWVIMRWDNKIGYIKRERLESVTAVDPVNTAPYGVQKATYLATTAETCPVHQSMSDQADSWVVLNPGTMLSIWRVQDGWGIVIYHRTYGYINMNLLTDLIPVSPTDTPVRADTPIAAYTSYYSMADNDVNKARLINIDVGCQRLTRVMAPGESFNFNKQVGPYRKANGYQPAWVLSGGTSRLGYGGGTCQVSSTLYNALMQLPGITILQRRPHGPSGAKYLPHGVDAAVGNDSLNLRFRNDYSFPIRVEGHTSYDGALLMVIYRVSDAELAAWQADHSAT